MDAYLAPGGAHGAERGDQDLLSTIDVAETIPNRVSERSRAKRL
jgi:hypothetical protein